MYAIDKLHILILCYLILLSMLFQASCICYRYLLTPQQRPHNVNDIMPMIGARFYTQLDAAMLRCDVIENELAKVGKKSPIVPQTRVNLKIKHYRIP